MFFGHHLASEDAPLCDVVEALTEMGAPKRPLMGDEIICQRLPALQSLPPEERMECLQRAKEEVLAAHLMRYTEEIRLAAFNHADCTFALGDFTPEAFPGRNNRRTPPKRAALAGLFYGKAIQPRQVARLTRLAFRLANFDPEQHPKEALPSGSVVYFASFAEKGVIKIGFTTNMRHRLRQFRSISSVDPTVHLTLPGDRSDERRLHRQFAADRITRELFHISPAITKFISNHRKPRPRIARPVLDREGFPAPSYSLIPRQDFFSPPNFTPTLLPLF